MCPLIASEQSSSASRSAERVAADPPFAVTEQVAVARRRAVRDDHIHTVRDPLVGLHEGEAAVSGVGLVQHEGPVGEEARVGAGEDPQAADFGHRVLQVDARQIRGRPDDLEAEALLEVEVVVPGTPDQWRPPLQGLDPLAELPVEPTPLELGRVVLQRADIAREQVEVGGREPVRIGQLAVQVGERAEPHRPTPRPGYIGSIEPSRERSFSSIACLYSAFISPITLIEISCGQAAWHSP